MINRLTTEHVDQARHIATLRSKHSGTAPTPIEKIDWLLESINQEDSGFYLFGYFEGKELISWAALKFVELNGEKVWVIIGLFTSKFNEHFTWNVPELGLLIKHAFEVAEGRGYYSYIYSIATRLERVYYHQWKKNVYLPPTGRYETQVVNRIPPNSTEAEEWQIRMAGLPKPDEISIMRRTLKLEYRNDSRNAP